MVESLVARLWQLAEGGEPATFLGRAHEPHEAATFERLLELGVLLHGEELLVWDPCEGCDCGAHDRPVRWLDGVPVAVCRFDYRQDERLSPDDLLVFRIAISVLVAETSAAIGLANPPERVMAGVWRLGKLADGRVMVAAPTRQAALQPGLVGVLRMIDPEGFLVLLGPDMPEALRASLRQQGIHHALLRDVARPPVPGRTLGLDLARLPHAGMVSPRLVLTQATLTVRLDQREGKLPARPFQLLCLLAERLRDGTPVVSLADIHRAIFSPGTAEATVRSLISELRRQLVGRLGKSDITATLIETRSNLGYALALPAKTVRIDP